MAKTATVEEEAAPQRTVVYLGNRKAIERVPVTDGSTNTVGVTHERKAIPGKRCTTVVLAPGTSLMEAAQAITSPQGVWAAHSDADAPAWVASTDPVLAGVLASHYGAELRDPEPQED